MLTTSQQGPGDITETCQQEPDATSWRNPINLSLLRSHPFNTTILHAQFLSDMADILTFDEMVNKRINF
jgi:hypothetical protein